MLASLEERTEGLQRAMDVDLDCSRRLAAGSRRLCNGKTSDLDEPDRVALLLRQIRQCPGQPLSIVTQLYLCLRRRVRKGFKDFWGRLLPGSNSSGTAACIDRTPLRDRSQPGDKGAPGVVGVANPVDRQQ